MSEWLSEKDVAEIREAYRGVDDPAVHALLAERDAHLARAKEASDLILRVVEGKLECGCEDHRNDALLAALSLLERTK